MSVKERLKRYLKFSGVSERKFATAIGVSSGYVSAISKSIQPDVINRITISYPELDMGWLMTGEGEMIKAPKNSFSQITPDEISDVISKSLLDEMMNLYQKGEIFPAAVHNRIVAEKDKKIEDLQREVWELKQKLR